MSGVDVTVFDTSGDEPHSPVERPHKPIDARAGRRVLDEVLLERGHQDAKWGEQNHPDYTPELDVAPRADVARRACQEAFKRGKGSWSHVLLEEVAEALEEGRAGDELALREELLQTAAVASAWVEAIDRRRRGVEWAAPAPVVPRPRTPIEVPEVVEVDDFLVCYGHVDQRLFVALAVDYVALQRGVVEATELVKRPVLDVRHRWAIELESISVLDEVGTAPGEPYVTWAAVHEDTPDSFPITLMEVVR